MLGVHARWIMLVITSYLVFNVVHSANIHSKKTYIVQMDKYAKPESFSNHLEWYTSKVQNTVSKTEVSEGSYAEDGERIFYHYQNAFHGFAARLTEEEVEKLEKEDGVLGTFPETKYELHTTRSPGFLGLERDDTKYIWSATQADHEVIVGVLDTGIWPESESFSDKGMTEVPAHWKGECETGRGFNKHHCNKKIVGARMFYHGCEAAIGKIDENSEYKSPRDQDGHGTHTAATVAGSPVEGANLLGYASGTARGMAPGARIAVYKVCWTAGCFTSDILSAVDRAVADGVDVLSISLGGGVSSYYRDTLSIAAFGAMEMGVFVSCSAGNGGPNPISLTNVSPWITTVGASTMDRDFPAIVRLGNQRNLAGVSLYRGRRALSAKKQYPLIYMGGNSSSSDPGSLCLEGTLDRHLVAGKIVICDRGITPRVQKGQVVKDAGGIGMILANTVANGQELVADCHFLPALSVGAKEAKELKHYALTTMNATATLSFLGTKLGIKPSPVVAAFSSRGPNLLSLEILKPDVIAPGVNILAAWTGQLGPSSLPSDKRRVKFNIISGTSMSCPHVSGIAALLKARHPEWNPAAIKSALMTTAYIHDNTNEALEDSSLAAPSTPYDHGAGHINPSRAFDPGLVYDIQPQDYFEFLCTQKLSELQLKSFSKYSNRTCHHTLASPGDLNYPAISVVFPDNKIGSTVTVHRTVTNVGPPVSNYHARITPLKGAAVTIEPKILNFTAKHKKLSFRITFKTITKQTVPEFGGLIWKDGVHRVRSPLILTWPIPL